MGIALLVIGLIGWVVWGLLSKIIENWIRKVPVQDYRPVTMGLVAVLLGIITLVGLGIILNGGEIG